VSFKSLVTSKYVIASDAYEQKRLERIEEAEKEVVKSQGLLKKAMDAYQHVKEDDPEKEKEIEDLEAEYEEAKDAYRRALETTIDDLKKDHAYDTWKENR